jgi:hypothetical protein
MKMFYYQLQSQLFIEMLCLGVSAAISCYSAWGQELSSPQTAQSPSPRRSIPSDNIQANGINGTPQPDGVTDNLEDNVLSCGPFGVHLDAAADVVYNDNIYVQPAHKTSDLIWTLTPQLSLGAGDYVQKEESWLTIDCAPSFIHFTTHDANDAIDEDARLSFEWRPASWTFGLKQSFQQLSGPVVEAGQRVNRDIYDTNLYAKYELSSKTTLELDGSQAVNDYAAPLFSYTLRTLSGWADYWMAPKIKVGAGCIGGFLDISDAFNQTYEQGLVRAEYDPSDNMKITGSAGAELREFQSGRQNKWNGLFSLDGNVQAWENGRILLDAYRQGESSLVAGDQNYEVTGISGGVSQVFDEKYTLSCTGGFNRADYYATAPDAVVNGSFDYFFVRTGIDWRLSGPFAMGVFYQYQQSWTSEATAFNNNLTGFQMAYHF